MTTDVTPPPPRARSPRPARGILLAAAAAGLALAAAFYAAFPSPPRAGGVVSLRQVRIEPGARAPLVRRVYALSNGLDRPLAFYPPDVHAPLFRFETFVTNSMFRQGTWESRGEAPVEYLPAPVWIRPGKTVEFKLDLPDDRRPRRLSVPLFGNAPFRKRCAAVAFSDGPRPAASRSDPAVGFWESAAGMDGKTPSVGCDAAGGWLLDGRASTSDDVRAFLRDVTRRVLPLGVRIAADDAAPLSSVDTILHLCAREALASSLPVRDGFVPLTNPMGEEWRLGNFVDRDDREKPDPSDPFAPAEVVLTAGSFSVNGEPCDESDLPARIAAASEDGVRAMTVFFGTSGTRYRELRLVLEAYRDIGGARPFLFPP